MANPGDGTDDVLDQQVEESDDQTPEDMTPSEVVERTGGLPGVTRDNIDARQGPHQTARNRNQASVTTMESGVTRDEDAVEEIYRVAQQEGEAIFERQEEFNERTTKEIEQAEEMKQEIEWTGTVETLEDEDALNLKSDTEYNREFAEGFTTESSGTNPVSVADGLDAIETDVKRIGAYTGDFSIFKGMFDTHFQEKGERNRSAAQSSQTLSELAGDARDHLESHKNQLTQDVETLRDELHLTSRADGSGDISAVANLGRRVDQYQEMQDTASENISSYEEAVSEADPSVSERASGAVRDLLGVVEEENEGVKAEFDPSEKEAVKTAWSMAQVAAADSMKDMYDDVQERKSFYEEIKETVEEKRQKFTDLQEDVEDLTAVEEVGEDVAEELRELDINTVLDLAAMEDGGELRGKVDDSVYGRENGDNQPFIQGRADQYVEDATDLVFGYGDEDTGLIDEYVDEVDSEVADNLDSTGEVTERKLKFKQLEGEYRKSHEMTEVLSDVEERVESELDDYSQAISDVEDRYDVEDLGEYIESEVESSRTTSNNLLNQDDQIES